MIEALIRTRPGSTRESIKKLGDVICVKLANSVWGSAEVKVHQLIEWEDADLELRLNTMLKNGEKYPVISNPYSIFIEDDKGISILTVRSSKYIDIEAMPEQLKDNVKNPAIEQSKLSAASLTTYKKERV